MDVLFLTIPGSGIVLSNTREQGTGGITGLSGSAQ
jgi:hypothetical protein